MMRMIYRVVLIDLLLLHLDNGVLYVRVYVCSKSALVANEADESEENQCKPRCNGIGVHGGSPLKAAKSCSVCDLSLQLIVLGPRSGLSVLPGTRWKN
jgi:hypothetical protein